MNEHSFLKPYKTVYKYVAREANYLQDVEKLLNAAGKDGYQLKSIQKGSAAWLIISEKVQLEFDDE